GQASARNLGLKLLQEDPNLKDKFTWVTFTDPDDFLDRDYFYEVDEFLVKNRDKSIAVMHAKQVLFFEKFNSYQDHPLSHYKHKDKVLIKKINDLALEVQSSTRSVFSLSLMDYQNRFKESVNYFEDVAFTLKFYTKCNDNDLAVFLSSSIYYIRKREDGNSTMNQSHKSRVFYIDALELCLETLKESKNKSKGLFLHTQYSVFSMIIYQIRSLVDNQQKLSFLSDLDKKRYIELLEEIFDLTDPKVIETFNAAGNNYFYKFGIVNCFKDTKLPFNIAYIKDYDCVKEQILVQYYSRQKTSIESIRFDGNEVYPDYEKIIEHNFLDKVFCYEKLLWVNVPKFTKDKLEIFIDGKQSMIGFKNYKISLKDIRKEFDLYNNIEDIWLFIDRDIEADDNAERLYRYVAKNYPNQKIVFALMRDCPDWSRLEKDGFNLVECYSAEFYQIAKKCKFFISSHTPNGYQVKLNIAQKFIFLGHGTDAVDISEYFNKLPIKLRTSTTYEEFNSLFNSKFRYKLTKKEVALTGQARHDALLAGNKTNNKNIMIMPTWRNYLVLPREKTFDRKIADNFLESEYFIKWLSLLNSNALEKLANDYNYTITFVPHFNMRDILNYLNIPNYIKIGYREDGESFQKYFQESDLMITDYTSAAFEMGYLKKPVIYYQFDEEEFFNSHTYTKGYFDYKRDGFGPVVATQEELLIELENLIKNNCQVSEPYRSNIENTFAF
ncbi:MAG: CDP-glycerol glycerophosphotransferase family protein, partial [Clostridia bacterium]|nr:CDP-glycerol glycerophosphotransferase family protein [Clostridia bacterium]